ncbi:MoaD/ThiS family protein [Aggregicoccus sp. 17bor-14]|uniref:ubiquitin-like small modifier protein 1 n=1 Tax=Myxococcaceae TaxID=31 RepID=UPI00129C6EBA|nr:MULTISPECIES: ubiquitin-like small modifier protein 1 [Myxococcaceae]MBF5044079.1 MoaD/ThiS family protein [Simulacricoccus sp. 17bor-14]MRI89830.1 MoaD/ThiS family protein [Aggregicoccus sp. 17bor-14]
MATVKIPTSLRSLAGERAELRVPGATLRDVLSALSAEHPALGARLLDAQGRVRRYVNVFVNDEDARFLQELDTPVADADRVTLVPAMAGG